MVTSAISPEFGEYRRTFEWRVTGKVKELWTELMDQLELYEEGTDEYEGIQDQIRSLPGHPVGTSREDLIVLEVTDFQV
jgi:hypothetical protein